MTKFDGFIWPNRCKCRRCDAARATWDAVHKDENAKFVRVKLSDKKNGIHETSLDDYNELKKKYEEVLKYCKTLENNNLKTKDKIINSNITEEDDYLEIGVGKGYTFQNIKSKNKIGVDPTPKLEENNEWDKNGGTVVLETSDDFFNENDKKFDCILIDGEHKVDNVLRDFINSLKVLNKNGKIFICDVLPTTEEEKTLSGNIWKTVYFILSTFSENIEFKLYHSGIIMFKFIGKIYTRLTYHEMLEKIKSYETEFEEYKKLLCAERYSLVDISF